MVLDIIHLKMVSLDDNPYNLTSVGILSGRLSHNCVHPNLWRVTQYYMNKQVHVIFHQDLISNSPSCLLYIPCNVNSKNLVLDQPLIP